MTDALTPWMPAVALTLLLVYGVLGFGWRSWLQYRRTGSSGLKGVSGALGSMEWFAGAGFVVAIVVALVAPALQWAGVLAPIPALVTPWLQVTGMVLAVVGIAGMIYAQLDMGASWRIGVDPAERTALVRSGVFARVRNPIFTTMLVFGAGIALVTPNVLALIGFALLLVTIEMQVRVVEEPYLASVHGADYRSYTATVGRFVPGVGRIPDAQ